MSKMLKLYRVVSKVREFDGLQKCAIQLVLSR
jgi:hypothetical protein